MAPPTREVDPHLVVIRPQIHDLTGELGPIVAEQELGNSALLTNLIQACQYLFALESLRHSMARLSRLNTFMMVKARNRRPSANWSATKSRLHTSSGAVGRRRLRRCSAARRLRRGLVAASGLRPCISGTTVSSPPSSLPGSAAQGSRSSRSAPALRDLSNSASAGPFVALAGSHSGRWRPESAPHDRHAARSPVGIACR